jgi:hypothetical protein
MFSYATPFGWRQTSAKIWLAAGKGDKIISTLGI